MDNITAYSVYDYKAVAALTRQSVFKKSNPKKQAILLGGTYTTLYVVIILAAITYGIDSFLWLMLAVLTMMSCLLMYTYFILPRIRYNAMGKLRDIENLFIFNDAGLSVKSESAEFSGTSTIGYSTLYRVVETDEYLFIYQSKSSAYVVKKSTVSGGTVDELRQRLRSALNDKYITRKC